MPSGADRESCTDDCLEHVALKPPHIMDAMPAVVGIVVWGGLHMYLSPGCGLSLIRLEVFLYNLPRGRLVIV